MFAFPVERSGPPAHERGYHYHTRAGTVSFTHARSRPAAAIAARVAFFLFLLRHKTTGHNQGRSVAIKAGDSHQPRAVAPACGGGL